LAPGCAAEICTTSAAPNAIETTAANTQTQRVVIFIAVLPALYGKRHLFPFPLSMATRSRLASPDVPPQEQGKAHRTINVRILLRDESLSFILAPLKQ
jgi:hypothetical protein